ncbi:hypothetical protein HK102_005980, partial [Quaeritorhiza haematococci]
MTTDIFNNDVAFFAELLTNLQSLTISLSPSPNCSPSPTSGDQPTTQEKPNTSSRLAQDPPAKPTSFPGSPPSIPDVKFSTVKVLQNTLLLSQGQTWSEVSTPPSTNTSNPTATQDDASTVANIEDKQLWKQFPLPVSVDAEKARISSSPSGLDVKVKVLASPATGVLITGRCDDKEERGDEGNDGDVDGDADGLSSSEEEVPSILSARELQDLDQISCRQCGAEFVADLVGIHGSGLTKDKTVEQRTGSLQGEQDLKSDGTVEQASAPRFKRVIDLPSEYWHELIDCWTCHQEDYFTKLAPKTMYVHSSHVDEEHHHHHNHADGSGGEHEHKHERGEGAGTNAAAGQGGGVSTGRMGVIRSQRDSALIGKGYVLLHPGDLVVERLVDDVECAGDGEETSGTIDRKDSDAANEK